MSLMFARRRQQEYLQRLRNRNAAEKKLAQVGILSAQPPAAVVPEIKEPAPVAPKAPEVPEPSGAKERIKARRGK